MRGRSRGRPSFANFYLHYVLDVWIEAWRKMVAHGEVIIVDAKYPNIQSRNRVRQQRQHGSVKFGEIAIAPQAIATIKRRSTCGMNRSGLRLRRSTQAGAPDAATLSKACVNCSGSSSMTSWPQSIVSVFQPLAFAFS